MLLYLQYRLLVNDDEAELYFLAWLTFNQF
jgi:hypothetical protein